MAGFKGNQILQVPKNENNKTHEGSQIPLDITGNYQKKIQYKLDIKCSNSGKNSLLWRIRNIAV